MYQQTNIYIIHSVRECLFHLQYPLPVSDKHMTKNSNTCHQNIDLAPTDLKLHHSVTYNGDLTA